MAEGGARAERAFGEALARAGAAALAGLEALEAVWRRLDPPELPALAAGVQPAVARAGRARRDLEAVPAPAGLGELRDHLARGVGQVERALEGVGRAPRGGGVAVLLGAMREHCRAQETLYPLRHVLKPLGRVFAEPAWHDRLEALDPEPRPGVSVGVHAAGADDDPDARGGFVLYVPERYRGAAEEADWPLVVALHGGFGHGRDFLWTWLREARSRRFLLLAPSSRGSTWALAGPDVDAAALVSMIEHVAERWRVDRRRILLTGLSDGGTYALLAGLAEDAPYTALAVVAGVLHPRNAALGNLERAAGRRIYWAHGARDWMFPVALARAGCETLSRAGADVVFREIADLSHAYPREENPRILDWFLA